MGSGWASRLRKHSTGFAFGRGGQQGNKVLSAEAKRQKGTSMAPLSNLGRLGPALKLYGSKTASHTRCPPRRGIDHYPESGGGHVLTGDERTSSAEGFRQRVPPTPVSRRPNKLLKRVLFRSTCWAALHHETSRMSSTGASGTRITFTKRSWLWLADG